MRTASLWFLAAILVGLTLAILGIPFNSGAGFLLVICWLVGTWRLATSRPERQER